MRLIDKIRKKYKIAKDIGKNELIAFLVSLVFKAKQRKRRKAKPKVKTSKTGNVEPQTIRASTIPGVNLAASTIPRAPETKITVYQADQKKPDEPIPAAAPIGQPYAVSSQGQRIPVNEFKLPGNRIAFASEEFKEYGKRIVDEAAHRVEEANVEAARKASDARRAEAKVQLTLDEQLRAWSEQVAKDTAALPMKAADRMLKSELKRGNNISQNKKTVLKPIISKYIMQTMPDATEDQKVNAIARLYGTDSQYIIAEIGDADQLPPKLQAAFNDAWNEQHEINNANLKKLFPRAFEYKETHGGIDEEVPLTAGQTGSGRKKPKLPRMLDNYEIDRVMKRYPGFLGAIAHNQIQSILPFVHKGQDTGLILNTDPLGKPGVHWQALFISPTRDRTVEWYDSFGDPMDPKLMPAVKQLVKKIDPPHHLKFKENRIDEQNANTDSCGYYCIKFLADRFRGIPFAKATGFPHDEKELHKWVKQFPAFKYIDV